MAKASPVSCVTQIGTVAGIIWQALSDKGPLTLVKLLKVADEPRDTVMQAIGWLAREGKIDITDKGRYRVVSLQQ